MSPQYLKKVINQFNPITDLFSLTSICGKIMESIICDKLVEHLTSHELLFNSHHGFLKNKSCLTDVLEFMEFLHTNMIWEMLWTLSFVIS